jgi:electron transfer flavoprotein-quinone oxidoreductase
MALGRLTAKGVFVIPKYRVDNLLIENGAIAGVKAGTEEIPAHVVVAADGVLSFMGEKAGLKPKMVPQRYAVGMKETIELAEEKINDRFNVESGDGCAHLFLGDVTKGLFGGGFLYTNQNTVSIGIVAGIHSLMEKTPHVEAYSLLDSFKERYEIKRLLDGGSLVEYSAHIIPEGGYNGISKLYGDGILLTGDAAGFALNMGVTVRGMEFALASGAVAAETIINAKKESDFSSRTLSYYEKRLNETFVMQDLRNNKTMPAFLENDDLFTFYPQRFPEFLEEIVWFGDGPKEKIGKTLWKSVKSSGALSFRRLKDIYRIKNL